MGQARLVVGITGASGSIYGLRVLDACRDLAVESHLVVSRSAALTIAQETDLSLADVQARAAPAASRAKGASPTQAAHSRKGTFWP